MTRRIPDEERAAILDTLKSGVSLGATARKHGRSKGSVSSIAKSGGISLERMATKKAVEAKVQWDRARRVALVGRGMEHAEAMLPKIAEAKELQSWFVSVATGIDKLRLEYNQPTGIQENRGGESELEREFRNLDSQLAEEVAQEGIT